MYYGRTERRKSVFDTFIQNLKSGSKSVENQEAEREFLRLIKKGDMYSVKTILDQGISVNFRFKSADIQKMTPIQIASLNHQEKLLSFLVEKGADVNYRYEELNNWSPLHLCVLRVKNYKETFSVLKILLENKCDWKLKDLNGKNFIELLLEQVQMTSKKKGESMEIFSRYFHQNELKSLLQSYFSGVFGRIHFDQECSQCQCFAMIGRRYYLSSNERRSVLCGECFVKSVSSKEVEKIEDRFRVVPNDVSIEVSDSPQNEHFVHISATGDEEKKEILLEREILRLKEVVIDQKKTIDEQRSKIEELTKLLKENRKKE